MQHDSANCEEDAGDADSSVSTGQSSSFRSSRGSSSSRTGCREDSQASNTQSDNKEDADTSSNKTLALSPSKKKDLSMTVKKCSQNNRGQWCPKKKKITSDNIKAHVFPPIKSNQRIISAHRHRVQELNNKVWELQHQLRGASVENKLLKQLQGRHTVALQHFQDSQSALPQILSKHSNEVQALQKLHRRSCIQHNSVSRRLRATEKELLNTKDSLHRLQMLREACSFEERVELSHRLNLVTANLDRKSKRIQELERNLELHQTSFTRHLATETRKTSEARELSSYLQAQISQLTKKIKERERELEICNIYAHRFPKGWNRKGKRETKSVQTEQIPCVPVEAPCQLELKYANKLECLESGLKRQKSLSWESYLDNHAADKLLDDRGPTDPDDFADNEEQDGDSDEEDLQLQDEENCTAEDNHQQVSEEEQTEPFEPQVRYNLETLNLEGANKGLKTHSRTKRVYRFKETIQNLHAGKPAYSSCTHSLRSSYPKYINSQAKVDNLASEVYEPSFVTLPANKIQKHDTTDPTPEGGVFQNKKSKLMKELFGQASITDEMAKQTTTSVFKLTGWE